MTYKTKLAVFLMSACFSTSVFADSAIELFEDNCAVCHGGNERGSDRAAPPIFAVQGHYLSSHPDRESFVKAVVDWIKKPDEARALMPGAIRRFELMPAIELSESDSTKIADFIYSGQFNRPGWYAEHYRQEHGEDPK